MADLNTGSHNMLSESTREHQSRDDTMNDIPGAFPTTPGTNINQMPGGFPDQQPQSLAPVETKTTTTTTSIAPATTGATSLSHGPSGHPIVSGIDDKEVVQNMQQPNFTGAPMNLTDKTPLTTHTSHPTPPRQSELDKSVGGYPAGLPPRIPRQADGNVAPGTRGVGETAVPIEQSPATQTSKNNAGTVKPGELAQEVAQGAATTAVAGGIAAKDAAVFAKDKAVENYPAARDTVVDNATWAKDQAVENYPAARDTVVDNATWAKDQAVENYPAVRDQTVSAATTAGNAAYSGAATAGNAAYSGAATAASAIASTAQAAYNATANAIPASMNPMASDATTRTGPPAGSVPETVKRSLAKSGESPEAAANPAAVVDKRMLESELMDIAGSINTDSAAKTSIAPNRGADEFTAKAPLAGHMPNRTESTDFVKILGTETYHKTHGPTQTGMGAAAQDMKPAHGGGPAGPMAAGVVTGGLAGAGAGAVLGQRGMQQGEKDTSYTYDNRDLKDPADDIRSTSTSGMGGQSSGVTGGAPRSTGDHVAPPTGTAAQAPGHGPSGQLPSYTQAQSQSQAPAKDTVGDNSVKEFEYNKLSSGTQSGVASSHYTSQ